MITNKISKFENKNRYQILWSSPLFDHQSDLTLNLCTCSASGPIMISSSTWTSAYNDDHDATMIIKMLMIMATMMVMLITIMAMIRTLISVHGPKKVSMSLKVTLRENLSVQRQLPSLISIPVEHNYVPVRGPGVQCRVILPCLQQVPVKCGSLVPDLISCQLIVRSWY